VVPKNITPTPWRLIGNSKWEAIFKPKCPKERRNDLTGISREMRLGGFIPKQNLCGTSLDIFWDKTIVSARATRSTTK